MENYQIVKQIGHGSYGEVWLVKCSRTKKKYVLKRIDLHRASKREQRAAHLEAKLLSTIKHPNIVTYLDSFYHSKGNLFIVMGYCECGDLYTYIRNQNGIHFKEQEIIHWFVQICMALKYLHDRNILHRDLKTQNIFLTKSKLIKVGDLGIARVLDSTRDMATTLIGTPYYMSPEIFAGKPYNHKSDVWALGCCIYEAATLKHAFNARDLHSLKEKVMKGKLNTLPDHYSTNFFNIISLMLNHDPEKRPSVTELLLNDYVRKHILIFLEESSIRSKLYDENNSDNTTQKSKPIQDFSLFKYHLQTHVKMLKRKDLTEILPPVITVPDVNGNGDGNDNSQHRSIKFEDEIQNTKYDKNYKQENITNTGNTNEANLHQDKNTNQLNNLKENRNLPNENVSPKTSLKTQNQHREQALKVGKNSSYEFLNNLTYTIKTTRFTSWESKSDTNLNLENKSCTPKYYDMLPKSAEDFYSDSEIKNTVILRKPFSARGSYASLVGKSIQKPPDQANPALPQIHKTKKECKPKNTRKKDKIIIPPLSKREIKYIEEIITGDDKKEFFQKSNDFGVDKDLLNKIMQCKSDDPNSPPRQRCKGKQKQSNSVPATLEFLFTESPEKKKLLKVIS